MASLTRRAHARLGLLGNPSDGYGGKAISFSLANFWAEVSIAPAEGVRLVPHALHDSCQHASLAALSTAVEGRGYMGGIQLLLAACRVFWRRCLGEGVQLDPAGFQLSYETNIPRQAGLSGSSALVTAALACLIDFHGVSERFPRELRPGLALQAEAELGITAGLQDRVIQVFQGLLFMDFAPELLEQRGHGRYEPLDPGLLPPLWLVRSREASHSGRVHSPVRRAWQAGDARVRRLMAEVASLAEQGRRALEARDEALLRPLMDRNFDLRLQLFGAEALGAANLRMVAIVRAHGGAAKLCGSGGAVVAAFPPGGAGSVAAASAQCEREGFSPLVRVEVLPAA